MSLRDKTPHQLRVELFMQGAKQWYPASPLLPSEAIRRLRAALLWEETMETIQALGFKVYMGEHLRVKKNDVQFEAELAPDLVSIVDGAADVSVVNTGLLTACGVADVGVLAEVDSNNLDKLGPGSSFRADGKLLKPPNHPKPNFTAVLMDQGWIKPLE